MGKVAEKYKNCLDAPNYTVFSNTTSSAEWNQNILANQAPVRSLESPHNSIHLAIGGFDVPGTDSTDSSPIAGANGDMGENDTAGLDPVFFFHHCFIDRVFWLWQQRHGFTNHLEIIDHYPGTNSVDSQGPTPGTVPNSWLNLSSPLDPFKKKENRKERPYTSLDCINIETQLGYTYGPGSLQEVAALKTEAAPTTKVVHVSGVNRASNRGSFLVSLFANIDGQRVHVGTEAVLSRWSVQSCANCQTHLEVKASFSLSPDHQRLLGTNLSSPDQYEVVITSRDDTFNAEIANNKLATSEPSFVRSADEAQPRKQTVRLSIR
jgi:tyrosinase